jgi:hypothetical protein
MKKERKGEFSFSLLKLATAIRTPGSEGYGLQELHQRPSRVVGL